MNIVAIIQARMGSSRLPGKILKKINGKTLLEYHLERVEKSKRINKILVATSTEESNDLIVELCEKRKVPTYRGSESDVLARYYGAAVQYNADVIVRLTSDCPFIDPDIIDAVVEKYIMGQPHFDYVSNTIDRTFPRGLDVEVFSFNSLKSTYEQAKLEPEREHVTAYMYTHPNEFICGHVINKIDFSFHRWTVDTEEDFQLISKLIEEQCKTNILFTMNEILNVLNENPEWMKLNAHIEQKKL